MKAKQRLESQIINMYLKNEITQPLKEAFLVFNKLFASDELSFEYLKNLLKRPKALQYMQKIVERKINFIELERNVSDEKYVKTIFDRLVKKGFLEEYQDGYLLTCNYDLDPDVLTDEELMIYDDFHAVTFNQGESFLQLKGI